MLVYLVVVSLWDEHQKGVPLIHKRTQPQG